MPEVETPKFSTPELTAVRLSISRFTSDGLSSTVPSVSGSLMLMAEMPYDDPALLPPAVTVTDAPDAAQSVSM